MISFSKIKKCQYRAFHWGMLKAIFDCLDDLSNLIFTASSFMKTDLKLTEHVVGFGNIVKTVGKNTFQKFDDT